MANHSFSLRYPPATRFEPFSPTGRDSRCRTVSIPASRLWMCAAWPRRASAHCSCVAFVMLPAHRDDDSPLSARFRAAHCSLS